MRRGEERRGRGKVRRGEAPKNSDEVRRGEEHGTSQMTLVGFEPPPSLSQNDTSGIRTAAATFFILPPRGFRSDAFFRL